MNAELTLAKARVLIREYLELKDEDPIKAEVVLDALAKLLLGDNT